METLRTVVFYVSKVLRPILASPLFLCLLACAAGLLVSEARGRARRMIKTVALVLLAATTALSLPIAAGGLAALWEVPLSDLDECLAAGPYDAVVVLGGSLDPAASRPRRIEGNDSFERLTAAAELYRAAAAPAVLASGGSGSITHPDKKEAPVMGEFLELMGVPRASLILESESRNTHENALYSKKMLEAAGSRRVVLVTSAWHMRRSAAVFRKAGIDFHVYAADSLREPFLFPADIFPDAWALNRSTRILREIAGYAAYGLMGRL